jgi:GNAT superfamily N-acetyltransferase
MPTHIIYRSDLKPESEVAGCNVRWSCDDDLQKITANSEGIEFVKSCLSSGGRIVVAEIDGQIAGWRFYMPSPCPQTYRFEFHAPDDVIFGFSAFVLPEHRGKRLFSAIHQFAANYYISNGYRQIVSLTGTWNAASRSAHKSAGEQPLLRIWSWTVFGFALIRYQGRLYLRNLTKQGRFRVLIE